MKLSKLQRLVMKAILRIRAHIVYLIGQLIASVVYMIHYLLYSFGYSRFDQFLLNVDIVYRTKID